MQFEMTSGAEKFIRRMIRFADVPASGGFRLAVSPGGCSGLEAEFEVLAQPRAGDGVVELNGVRLFVPVESRLLLDGVTIDYADSPTESGFVFRDPKSRGSACGTPSTTNVQLVNLATPSGGRG